MSMSAMLFILMIGSAFGSTFSSPRWITVDKDVAGELIERFGLAQSLTSATDDVTVLEVGKGDLAKISHFMHSEKKRCGGYQGHYSQEEAVEAAHSEDLRALSQVAFDSSFFLSSASRVETLLKEVKESEITDTIVEMTAFHNRHYQAPTGIKSMEWLKKKWENLGKGRADYKVEFFKHARFNQPSVIATIKGSQSPEEVVIIGGHADSIGGGFWGRHKAKAPGADDNASGIATITEAMRVLLASDFKPKKSIMFMAYAAEEVGLLGSKDIAAEFARKKQKVVSVIQYDMVNYKGGDKSIYLATDYSNADLRTFMGKLIETYVKVPWGYMKCGYGCSDHASWTNKGFPAMMATESTFNAMNKAIHSSRDTLSASGGDSKHAVNFAKLALAYLIESAKE
jgi:bacterial leucyl aminopeptidase